jgi:hypothetical protein
VSQNSRNPNSERGREGPSGARKILRKNFALPEKDISTLILFNTFNAFISTVTKYYSSYVVVPFLRKTRRKIKKKKIFFTPK